MLCQHCSHINRYLVLRTCAIFLGSAVCKHCSPGLRPSRQLFRHLDHVLQRTTSRLHGEFQIRAETKLAHKAILQMLEMPAAYTCAHATRLFKWPTVLLQLEGRMWYSGVLPLLQPACPETRVNHTTTLHLSSALLGVWAGVSTRTLTEQAVLQEGQHACSERFQHPARLSCFSRPAD